ncbi:hypothetical protein DMC30DRAFT_418618 [Rhodotorula diobovata]|uniref:HMG box domain-containing protein n=1 Tax=Rhodotorula diobovata TaxID=5288 RepID=A0A5C5FPD8_9BASI|nr:hypothetical protein DMC30DRAFT_418618 [Rhodotorula diobovata]
MSYDDRDQYITAPHQPAFSLQPPTPITAMSDAAHYTVSSSSSSTSPMPIPISASSSRASSRAGTPSLSRSGSARHHPYSPASFKEQPLPLLRPRSATSASDHSTYDSEFSSASFDAYGSSVDSYGFSPPSSYDLEVSRPSTASSPYVADGPVKIGRNGKPVKSHSRKQAPGHIKRPPNAFILFRSHCCSPESADPSQPEPPGTAHARYLASLEINNSQHISMIVSQVWNSLKAEDRAYWDDKARLAKEEHKRLHPDYRYRPQQRAKETVRRRKKPEPKERHQERSACTQVAQQVLKLDGTGHVPIYDDDDMLVNLELHGHGSVPSGLPTAQAGPRDEVAAPFGSSPDNDKPARRTSPRKTARTRRAPVKPKAQAATPTPAPAAQGASSRGLCTIQLNPTLAAPAQSSHQYSYPFPAPSTHEPSLLSQRFELGDFSSASATRAPYGRRTSHTRTHVYESTDNDDQFSYMAQLNSHLGSQLSAQHSSASFPIDPRLADATDPSSQGYPAFPADVSPFDPHFSYAPPASVPQTAYSASPYPVSSAPAPAPASSRPATAHDDGLSRMQSYTLGVPSSSASSTSSFGSSFGDLPNPGAMLAERRAAAPPVSLDALQQRRGTICASDIGAAGGGDLMLISPLTTTFNGRRQSVGWQSTLRRVSLVGGNVPFPQPGEGQSLAPAAPPGRRSSLATGVISAQEFEAFTFSQALLETIPAEPADDLFAGYAFGTATGLSPPGLDADESERPSTAGSTWSEDGVERLDGQLPPGFFDRRRSTIVASKFVSSLSSEAGSPSSQTYHVGSTDFFLPPGSALSTAPTSASMSLEPTHFDGQVPQSSPAFGSPDFGGSFQPHAPFHRLSIGNILASAATCDMGDWSCAPPAPTSAATGLPGDNGGSPEWLASTQQGDDSGSGMHTTALSVLNERRAHLSTSPQVPQAGQLDNETSLAREQGNEHTYVFLTMDQLQDEKLMSALQGGGYGIALSMPPEDSSSPPLPSPGSVPSVGNLCLGSPSSAPVPL